MTALLQPLDTHVFARFKLFLRTRLHQFMLSGRNRDLLVEEVLDALMHAMKGVLQRNAWASAFANNGFGPGFQVRPHLLESLEWTSHPVIASDLPSLTQFQSCFPANRYIPFMGLLSGLVPRPEGPPKRERERERQPATPPSTKAKRSLGGNDYDLVLLAERCVRKQRQRLLRWDHLFHHRNRQWLLRWDHLFHPLNRQWDNQRLCIRVLAVMCSTP